MVNRLIESYVIDVSKKIEEAETKKESLAGSQQSIAKQITALTAELVELNKVKKSLLDIK